MKHKWIWAALAVLVAVIIIAGRIRSTPPQSTPEQHATHSHAPSSSTHSVPETERRTVSESEPAGAPDPEFKSWVAMEAESLNLTKVDGDRKEAEIKEVLKKLTPMQAKQLLHTARDPKAPAGEKILSTYLLVEGGINSRKELLDLIQGPLTEQGPHEAHSDDEIKGVREKSLRIMAIDGLFSQAQKDPSARTALVREIQDIHDPYIKAYAQRKLEELQTR